MDIDFDSIVALPSGVRVINCTPHSLIFKIGETSIVVALPCGAKLMANTLVGSAGTRFGAQLVKTEFVNSLEGLDELAEIERRAPGVLVIGSIISAQAYPGRVVGVIATPGYERVPPAEKRVRPDKFTVF